MAKGSALPAEGHEFQDEGTGAAIRQVTDHPSIHHHPFFFVPAYDHGMRRLVFVSHRMGAPQVFAEDLASRRLVQMTDRPDIDEWSVYPSRNGKWILFTAGGAAWRLDAESLREEELLRFGPGVTREPGMVGVSLGTTALSWDDRWWAVPAKIGKCFRLFVIEVETGAAAMILEREKIGHPQFCPDDSNLILYIGDMTDRTWIVTRDGAENRLIYRRSAEKNEWITHETWIPGRREVAIVDWPKGVRAVHVDTGDDRRVCTFNAWHAICDRTGRRMVADTNFPDTGVHLFDPLDGIGEPRSLCQPRSSQMGTHWAGPFPYGSGPVKVFAPQHTHAHPSFSPDGRRVVFTSDRTGHSQVYECRLPKGVA